MQRNADRQRYLACFYCYGCLEDTEGLLSGLGTLGFVCQHVETHGLRQRAALSDGDDVSVLDGVKCRRAVGGNVLVSFLKTTVLRDVVQVVSSYDDRSLHLGGHDLTLYDSPADGYVSGEGAFLVHVVSLNRRIGSLNTETNVLYETHGLLARRLDAALASDEDGVLLLVRLFVLVTLDIFLWGTRHLELLLNDRN
jgi:hypothetical protein